MENMRRKAIFAVSFMFAGAFLFVIFFSATNYLMQVTTKPEFCIKCHEMKPAYDSWKTSSHHTNEYGVVVDCGYCHLPSHKDTFRYMAAKAYVGNRDVILHFFGGEYDREKMREKVTKTMPNKRCLQCHANLLVIPDNAGARMAHTAALFPAEGEPQERCLSCHTNLVHVDKELYHQ